MFDGLDNLLALTQISNDATHTVLGNFTGMVYDATGNRLGMDMSLVGVSGGNGFDASGSCGWSYDTQGKQDQLTGEGRTRFVIPGYISYGATYQSDAADNLIANGGVGISYNADNQLPACRAG